MVPDVQSKLKTCAVIRRLERRNDFKEIVQWIVLTRKDTSRPFGFGESGQHFGHVISHRTIVNIGAFEDVTHQNVKVKTRRDLQAAAMFEQSVEEGFVIEN